MKKIISFLFITMFILSNCIILTACGKPKSSPVKDFEYEFEDGTVIITGYTGNDLEIVVPDTISDRPVTTIGKDAFEKYDMKSIIIPEGVTTIESGAFDDCNNLENIEIPDTIKEYECGLGDTKWFDEQPDGVLYLNNFVVGQKGDATSDAITIKNGTIAIFGLIKNDIIHIPESVKIIRDRAIGYKFDLNAYWGGHYILDDNAVIYGKSGSEAERYAKENKIKFIAE